MANNLLNFVAGAVNGTGPDGGKPTGGVAVDRFGNMFGTTSGGGQHGCEVVERAPRLRRDVVTGERARARVESDLTAAKQEAVACDGLAVGTDGRRRRIGPNPTTAHTPASCAVAVR